MRAFLKSPLFLALAVAVLSLPTQFSQVFDHVYWNVWYKGAPKVSPDDAVIVSTDNGKPIFSASIASSTAKQAELLRVLAAASPARIFLDYPIVTGADDAGDTALKAELNRVPKLVTLVNRAKVERVSNTSRLESVDFVAPSTIGRAASAWDVNFLGYVQQSPVDLVENAQRVPSVSAINLAKGSAQKRVFPDFRVDPRTIPVLDAQEVLKNSALAAAVAHRTVFITATNSDLDTAVGYYGYGRAPAAVADIAGARGLARGVPIDLGSVPFLVLLASGILLGRHWQSRRGKVMAYASLTLALLVMPGLLREINVVTLVGPALIGVLVYGPARATQKWRNRVQMTSAASGLPNIDALAAIGIPRTQDVVSASVSMYEQMLASLPRELHGECARQIARRLSLGAGDRTVYDNDSGHFVWLEDSRTLDGLVEHLEGLKALFSAPLVIEGHVLDTNIHFGLDRNVESRPTSRIQSALASANEAQSKGKLYEEFGQQRLAQSPWELSLHARIDEGLRNGDIWLALQPQYDFRYNRVSGAEALIRWNDPERGAIPPDAFILQAERAGRIESITYWVLEKSIGMARELNRIAGPFQISVNLSARIVDHPALVRRIADIVRETEADCSLITFEVTETFSMANRDLAKQNLAALRAMGFRLSIDDFGTGQASLTYLAEIPSDEIKLDRQFVQALTRSPRDRQIVESVIGLAHALGQDVVAEGIEDVATLETLRRIGCDLAQGYYVGKPMKYADLFEQLDPSHSGAKLGANMYV